VCVYIYKERPSVPHRLRKYHLIIPFIRVLFAPPFCWERKQLKSWFHCGQSPKYEISNPQSAPGSLQYKGINIQPNYTQLHLLVCFLGIGTLIYLSLCLSFSVSFKEITGIFFQFPLILFSSSYQNVLYKYEPNIQRITLFYLLNCGWMETWGIEIGIESFHKV